MITKDFLMLYAVMALDSFNGSLVSLNKLVKVMMEFLPATSIPLSPIDKTVPGV